MRITCPSGLILIPYFPFGIVLFVLRTFIFLHALLVSLVLFQLDFARRFVLRCMCLVLGFVVKTNGYRSADNNTQPTLVSNHITLYDHLILCLLQDCITPHHHVFRWKSIYSQDYRPDSISDRLRIDAEKSHRTIHIMPERSPSGRSDCILKFDSKMFASLNMVQPIAISVQRIFPIKLIVHPISWPLELFWQLFTPFTWFNVQYLAPMNRLPNESDAEFSNRVRSAIAACLKASLSPLRAEDLSGFYSEHPRSVSSISINTLRSPAFSSPTTSPQSSAHSTSRCSISSLDDTSSGDMNTTQEDGVRYRGPSQLHDQEHKPSAKESTHSSPTHSSFVFEHLVPQVLEVLNHVPLDRVRQALARTEGDVEMAVDLLLDDSNTFTDPQEEVGSKGDAQSVLSPSRLDTSASEFCSNPKARQMSLAQRREQLIAHARNSFKVKGQLS